MNDNRTFLGRGWNYPSALDKDGTPTRMAAYEENIQQSLWTLLSTSPGERVHRYDYGCPIRRYASRPGGFVIRRSLSIRICNPQP